MDGSDIRVTFGGGKRVDAHVGGFVVRTDQPEDKGGEGTAPSPFTLFLASLATCAGIYVLGFCQARGLSTEGISIVQRHRWDETGKHLLAVELDVRLPQSFPPKYVASVQHAAQGCLVKKTLETPPELVVRTFVGDSAAAA